MKKSVGKTVLLYAGSAVVFASVFLVFLFFFNERMGREVYAMYEIPTAIPLTAQVRLRTEELIERSTLIVEGTVTDISEPFQVQSVEGSVSQFRYYYVTPDKILRGQWEEEGPVPVRLEVRAVQGQTVESDSPVQLEKGEEYLLFLQRLPLGGDFATHDTYLNLTINTSISVQTVSHPPFSRSAVLSDWQGNQQFADDLYDTIAQVNQTSPPDPEAMAQEVLDNIRACYEQDVITWEGYLEAVEYMEQYATVLPD